MVAYLAVQSVLASAVLLDILMDPYSADLKEKLMVEYSVGELVSTKVHF